MKSSIPPWKACFPWASKGGSLGILPGCPGPPKSSKSLCAKRLCSLISGKKKVHKHKLFGPVGLWVFTGFVPGTNPVCPWDKSSEIRRQTQVFSLFYTVEARGKPEFVPGTNPGLSQGTNPGPKGGTKSLCEKVYVPFSLTILGLYLKRCGMALVMARPTWSMSSSTSGPEVNAPKSGEAFFLQLRLGLQCLLHNHMIS